MSGEGGAMGGNPQQQLAAQNRLKQTQAQVDEVVGIMRLNVEKVIERDQRLSELDDRSIASMMCDLGFGISFFFTSDAMVVGIMRENVEKVMERDQKLSELDDRADALQQGASQFEQQSTRLRRKYWWQNIKMMIILGVILLIIIIIIAISLGLGSGGGSSDKETTTTSTR